VQLLSEWRRERSGAALRGPEMAFPALEPGQAVEVVNWLAECDGMHLDSSLPAVFHALRAIPAALEQLDTSGGGCQEDCSAGGLVARLSALADSLVRHAPPARRDML
jgi:hypothetical protein